MALYKELVLSDNHTLEEDYDKLILEINKNINTSITGDDIRSLDYPTISEMEEDYMLIYKHCAI